MSKIWIRAAVRNQAQAQGWTLAQLTTATDTLTKGDLSITITYGSSQVTTVGFSKGDGSPLVMPALAKGKLQAISTALGHKVMKPTQKWAGSDLLGQDGKPTDVDTLKAQALAIPTIASEEAPKVEAPKVEAPKGKATSAKGKAAVANHKAQVTAERQATRDQAHMAEL